MGKWFLRREDPDHGFNYSYMTVELQSTSTTPTVVFVYPDGEEKTYMVTAARAIWDTLINDDWNAYIPEEKSEVAPQPKERLRRKKQRVKSAMTGFDKLRKNWT
jgi:hypothetical protein